jgi:hypothetical protein
MKVIRIQGSQQAGDLSQPSYSYNDGLYVVVSKTAAYLKICKLDENMSHKTFANGKPVIVEIGNDNPYVSRTNLYYSKRTFDNYKRLPNESKDRN